MSWIEERVGTASGVLLLVAAWVFFLTLRLYGGADHPVALTADAGPLDGLTIVWSDLPQLEAASPVVAAAEPLAR
jgi:hypothetical protein